MDNNRTLNGIDNSITNEGTGRTLLFQMKVKAISSHDIILATILNTNISNIENGIIRLVSIESSDVEATLKLNQGSRERSNENSFQLRTARRFPI